MGDQRLAGSSLCQFREPAVVITRDEPYEACGVPREWKHWRVGGFLLKMRNPEWQYRRPCRFFEYLPVRPCEDITGALDLLWGTRGCRVTDGAVGGNGGVGLGWSPREA